MISRINRAVSRRVRRVVHYVSNKVRVRACDVRGHVILLDVESAIEDYSLSARALAEKYEENISGKINLGECSFMDFSNLG